MVNRIEDTLKSVSEKNEKALVTYVTAGLPDMEGTKAVIRALEEAGTDIIELGIPFSDPIADGPVVQQASYEAIQRGTNLKNVFGMVKELREQSQIAIVFMMYYNTVLHYGLREFAAQCVMCGVDGLIIPDLPYEEQGSLQAALDGVEGAPILLQIISPASKERAPMILEKARGFVYCISSVSADAGEYLEKVKASAEIPVMLGGEIKNAGDARELMEYTDGVVIDSYLITLLKENRYNLDVLKKYIRDFKAQMR